MAMWVVMLVGFVDNKIREVWECPNFDIPYKESKYGNL